MPPGLENFVTVSLFLIYISTTYSEIKQRPDLLTAVSDKQGSREMGQERQPPSLAEVQVARYRLMRLGLVEGLALAPLPFAARFYPPTTEVISMVLSIGYTLPIMSLCWLCLPVSTRGRETPKSR